MKLIFDANEQEKKEILEQHNLIKKILHSKIKKVTINEQTTPLTGRDLLIAAREKKCKIAVGGKIKSAPGKPTVLYKIADYDSDNGYFKKGDELYIKGDYTFDVVITDESGKKTLSAQGKKWGCNELNTSTPQLTDEQKGVILTYDKSGFKDIKVNPAESSKYMTVNLQEKYPKLFTKPYMLYQLITTVDVEPLINDLNVLVSTNNYNDRKTCKDIIEKYWAVKYRGAKVDDAVETNWSRAFNACDANKLNYLDLGITNKKIEKIKSLNDELKKQTQTPKENQPAAGATQPVAPTAVSPTN
jgi:hypothetical protein